MKPDPERIRALFVAALGASDPAGWEAFLVAECGGDRELYREVKSLLEAHLEAGSLLRAPAVALADEVHWPTTNGAAAPAEVDGPGAVIGPYKLLQAIGEGGMGTVYMAEQT